MTPRPVADVDREAFQRLKDTRTAALEHFLRARELSTQRKMLITELVESGYSQSDIARELGVTRQAIQKMLAAG
jgi:DNA-binding NarL/FixJ family response regulator